MGHLGYPCDRMDDNNRDDGLLTTCNQIVVTAGLPPSHYIYQHYGHKTCGELDRWYEVLQSLGLESSVTTIGITGTDGKSTTSRITYHLFQQLIKRNNLTNYRVVLGGNFEPSYTQLIYEILQHHSLHPKCHTVVVLEVSSFMAHRILTFRCEYSIFTNFHVDHLNRHHDIEDYFLSKAKLLQHTIHSSRVHPDLAQRLKELWCHSIQTYQSDFDIWKTVFIGQHNAHNRWAALDVVAQRINDNSIQQVDDTISYQDITPLPHRTQFITTIQGVQIYSDAHGLTGQAQSSALQSFGWPIGLICGGSDKGFDFSTLSDVYSKYVVVAWCFGQMKEQFHEIFEKIGIRNVVYDDFGSCVHNTLDFCIQNNIQVLLFSPWCASFDSFNNRQHRADTFLHLLTTFSLWT